MANNRKAQGTIEYLVIIAIVVVIALVVVGLLLQLSSPAKGATENNSKTTWKTATPFAVVDWSYTADGNLTVVLQNNSESAIDFVNMAIVGSGTSTGDVNNITQGSKITKKIPMAVCTPSSSYSFGKDKITISYRTPSISSTRTQTAMADIVGTCN